MKNFIVFVSMSMLVCVCALSADETRAEEIMLKIGESSTVVLKNLNKIAIGDPKVLDAVVISDSEILINGKIEGTTSLNMWSDITRKDYIVKVVPWTSVSARDIENIINIEGVVVRMGEKGAVILDGEVATKQLKERAEKITGAFASRVINVIKVKDDKPEITPVEAKFSSEELAKIIAIDTIKITVTENRAVLLDGYVENREDRERAEKIAGGYYDRVISVIKVREQAKPDTYVKKTEVRVQPKITKEELKSMINEEGIEMTFTEDGVLLLDGYVRSRERKERAEKISSAYFDRVISVIEVKKAEEPIAKPEETRSIQKITAQELKKMINIETISIVESEDKVILDGMVENQSMKDRSETIARLFYPSVLNLVKVREPEKVLVEMQVIEINKDALGNIGLQWGPGFQVGTLEFEELARNVLTQTDAGKTTDLSVVGVGVKPELGYDYNFSNFQFTRMSPLQIVLKFLEQKGEAKFLATPRVLVLSGSKASVQIGGEIPYPFQTQHGISIDWKKYGILLEVSPSIINVSDKASISMDIKSVVSEIDGANAVPLSIGTIPALKENSTLTHVTVSDNETIVISGLIKTSKATIVEQIPLLGEIPFLGEIFKKRNTTERQTELVVFITPKIIKSAEDVGYVGEHGAKIKEIISPKEKK